MLNNIHYNEDKQLNGYIEYLKRNNEDIISNGLVKIWVSSQRSESNSPYVLFDYKYNKNVDYWSTENNDTNKFIIFSFKHILKLNGIEIKTNIGDWYEGYEISASMDMISWTSQTTVLKGDFKEFAPLYFPIFGFKYGRFIKITPYGDKYDGSKNFALYRVEFYGKVIKEIFICTYLNKIRGSIT